MTPARDLLDAPPVVATVGPALFADAVAAQGARVERVAWEPPRLGTELEALWRDDVDAANRRAVERLLAAQPVLIDVRPAIEALPGMRPDLVLHAGPPIDWARMSGPLRGAVIGALLYEGRAGTPEDAERLAASGRVDFAPCHHHAAVGPMAGVTTASMPVLVVEDRAHGHRAYSTLNEGLGKVLRYGAFSPDVLDRLRWFRDTVGPALAVAVREAGGIDVRAIIAQAVQMGDECDNRNRAASALLVKALAPAIAGGALPAAERRRILAFAGGNEHLFLNLAMAAAKTACDAAHGVPGSSLVTAMARNGTDFGIRVAGLGDRWLTAPVNTPSGLYFAGFGPADANPDIGDSAIVETIGLGGFAMAASPAVAGFVGAGGLREAIAVTEEMAEIAIGEHPHFRIPTLDDRGAPVGIDVRRVVATGITPLINTGIAGRRPGVGQIGAGTVRAPLACFEQALAALAGTLGISG